MSDDEARFWAKVSKTDNCWNWAAGKTGDGYGTFQMDGRTLYAHRVAFFIANGRWPKPNALHGCDNPGCVRVGHGHVREGTQSENMEEMRIKGRKVYLRGEQHGSAKLTEGDVCEIRELRGLVSQSEIARRFGVSQSQVSNIQLRKYWPNARLGVGA